MAVPFKDLEYKCARACCHGISTSRISLLACIRLTNIDGTETCFDSIDIFMFEIYTFVPNRSKEFVQTVRDLSSHATTV